MSRAPKTKPSHEANLYVPTKDHAAIAEAAKYDYSSHYMEQSDLLQLTQDQSTIVMNATIAHDDDEHEIEFEAKRTNNKTMDDEL
jgi:hypothetical protein